MTEEEFWKIYLDVPDSVPIFYRAYYNSDGWVELYTMEDLPGNYIEIDQQTYNLAPRARVVNNKLVKVEISTYVSKLVPKEYGTACHPSDVCIVTDQEPNIKWSLTNNE